MKVILFIYLNKSSIKAQVKSEEFKHFDGKWAMKKLEIFYYF